MGLPFNRLCISESGATSTLLEQIVHGLGAAGYVAEYPSGSARPVRRASNADSCPLAISTRQARDTGPEMTNLQRVRLKIGFCPRGEPAQAVRERQPPPSNSSGLSGRARPFTRVKRKARSWRSFSRLDQVVEGLAVSILKKFRGRSICFPCWSSSVLRYPVLRCTPRGSLIRFPSPFPPRCGCLGKNSRANSVARSRCNPAEEPGAAGRTGEALSPLRALPGIPSSGVLVARVLEQRIEPQFAEGAEDRQSGAARSRNSLAHCVAAGLI